MRWGGICRWRSSRFWATYFVRVGTSYCPWSGRGLKQGGDLGTLVPKITNAVPNPSLAMPPIAVGFCNGAPANNVRLLGMNSHESPFKFPLLYPGRPTQHNGGRGFARSAMIGLLCMRSLPVPCGPASPLLWPSTPPPRSGEGRRWSQLRPLVRLSTYASPSPVAKKALVSCGVEVPFPFPGSPGCLRPRLLWCGTTARQSSGSSSAHHHSSNPPPRAPAHPCAPGYE